MPPVLPPELLGPIVRYIDPKDVATIRSLLLSSRALWAEAEPVLYHTFSSHHQDPHTDGQWIETSELTQLGFLNRVVESDRVASHVRRMNIEFLMGLAISQPFCEAFEKALPRMRNLELLAYMSYDTRHLSHILASGQCQFQLKTLEWNCAGTVEDLQVFLPTQQRLERIIAYDWGDETKIIVPALKELCVHDASAALSLIPGGTVKSLRLEENSLTHEPDHELPDDFLAGIGGLVSLSIRAWWLLAVVDHLENVHTLDFWGPEPPEFVKVLRRIPQLRYLTLSQVHPKPTKKLIKEIFRQNRKLERIDVRNTTDRCVRWFPGSDVPISAPRENFFSYLPWNNGDADLNAAEYVGII